MRRTVLALTLFTAAALTADEPKKDEKKAEAKLTKKELGKMMKDTHHGEKSPHVRTAAELKKDSPDWEQITKDVKAFAAMGEALKAFGPYQHKYTPAELGYIKTATALSKAAGDKDKKAATEAFVGLTKSCVACHFYGGPGGAIK